MPKRGDGQGFIYVNEDAFGPTAFHVTAFTSNSIAKAEGSFKIARDYRLQSTYVSRSIGFVFNRYFIYRQFIVHFHNPLYKYTPRYIYLILEK